MLEIQSAKYIKNYSLNITFNNGNQGIVDLKSTIFNDHRAIFSELKDPSNFINFTLKHNTICWFNQLDLSPEFLFYLVFKEEKTFEKTFKDWGFIS